MMAVNAIAGPFDKGGHASLFQQVFKFAVIVVTFPHR